MRSRLGGVSARQFDTEDREAGTREGHPHEPWPEPAPARAQVAGGARGVYEQPLVQGGDGRGGRRAQVIPQDPYEAVICEQGLRDVSLRGQGLHQERVSRLAVRSAFDQAPRDLLGRGAVAAGQRRPRLELARVTAELFELDPALLDPWSSASRQELVLEDVPRRRGMQLRELETALLHRGLGGPELLGGSLDVDPGVVGEHQPELPAALEAVRAEHPARPRQHRAQRDVA